MRKSSYNFKMKRMFLKNQILLIIVAIESDKTIIATFKFSIPFML